MVECDEIREFQFIGGRRCVDFVNTQVIEQGELLELIRSDEDLLRWAVRAGLPNPRRSVTHGGRSRLAPAVLETREAMRSVLEHHLDAQPPSSASLAVLNQILDTRLPAEGRLRWRERSWHLAMHGATVESVLRVVVEDLVALLRGPELGRLGRCANERCVLLFLDRSRSRARRWCSMEVCGNRAKVAEHQRKSREL